MQEPVLCGQLLGDTQLAVSWIDSLVGWLRVGDQCGVDVVNLLVDDCFRCPKQSPLVVQGKWEPQATGKTMKAQG